VNETDRDPESGRREPLDDASIERLVRDAGPRPPIPREDLDSIAVASRAALQARERARQEGVEPAPSPPRPGMGQGAAPPTAPASRWRQSHAIAALALAAALAAILFGARAWWLARRGETSSPVATLVAARVAVVAASTATLRVEEGGVERPLAPGDAIGAGAIVRTASSDAGATGQAAARGALRLESGAVVRLDAATSARLASPTRIDLLAGALYADTDPESVLGAPRHGSIPALEIHTSLGVARDVGTRFMTRLVAGNGPPTLEVLVRDGIVAVERDSQSALVNAGERITARAGAAIESGPAPTWGPEWEWVIEAAPPFEVAGQSMASILDWVARETGWTVRYEDEALAAEVRVMIQQSSRTETGAWRPDQAPFVLLPGAKLEGEVDAGVLTVRRQPGHG
jgi:hypothetical protein